MTVAFAAVAVACALWTGSASVQSFMVVVAAIASIIFAQGAAETLSALALDPRTPRSVALAKVSKGTVASFTCPAVLAAVVASLSGTGQAPYVGFGQAWLFFVMLGTAPFLWFLRSGLRGSQDGN